MNKKQQEQYFILNVVMVGILIILLAMLVDCGINAYANETEETTSHEQYMVSAWCYKRPSKENPDSIELTWRCYKFITPSWIREDIGAAIPYTVMV